MAQDDVEAMKWYKKSAEAGLPLAMSNIAYFYAQGRGGVKQDIAEARKWWQKAADLGEAKAMMPLAEACLNGQGGPADPDAAVRWYQKAAESSDPTGMRCYALIFENGLGNTKQDAMQSAQWMRKAAEAGDAVAMFNVGIFVSVVMQAVIKTKPKASNGFTKLRWPGIRRRCTTSPSA